VPSISPFTGECVLCGFFDDKGMATKFKITLSSERDVAIESSTDPSTAYYAGLGGVEFEDIWNRLPKIYERKDVDPPLSFSCFAAELYKKQFLGQTDLIYRKNTGGAITGLFSRDGKISWQPSWSTVTFINVGGTGFCADFRWLQVIYKTWADKGNVFSSSMFEQNGRYFQRITQYRNSLSSELKYSPDSLLPEMKTFNSQMVSVLLLPKGFSGDLPAVLVIPGQLPAFDEILEDGRIVGVRLNSDFIKRISEEFFVCGDFSIQIGLNRFRL
jgi:hypothetical protein